MTTGIQPERLDDIQLSIYLAQKNNQGQPTPYILAEADRLLDWLYSKRGKQKVENVGTISQLLNKK